MLSSSAMLDNGMASREIAPTINMACVFGFRTRRYIPVNIIDLQILVKSTNIPKLGSTLMTVGYGWD